MFRPIAAIIRFSSESMVVVLYGIGMVMSRWWDLNICDVCYYLLLLKGTGGGYLWCALSWGVQLKYVCSLLSYVGLQLLFVHFRCLLLVGWKPDDGRNRPKHVVTHPLLNIFLDIVVLLTDTNTYCLY